MMWNLTLIKCQIYCINECETINQIESQTGYEAESVTKCNCNSSMKQVECYILT